MCGGYSTLLRPLFFILRLKLTGLDPVNRDDYISKYRMTNLTKEQIAASTVTG
jgi:hypothetical protein